MSSRMMRLALPFLVVATTGLASAPSPAPPSRVALVIGNGAYQSNALKNPPNDAEDVAAALKDSGFEVSLVKDASLDAMDKAVNDFAAKLKAIFIAMRPQGPNTPAHSDLAWVLCQFGGSVPISVFTLAHPLI